MQGLLSIAIFHNIFTKNNVPAIGYNIKQTDWESYARAMAAVPGNTQNKIIQIALHMQAHYQAPWNYDNTMFQFWKSMEDRCGK